MKPSTADHYNRLSRLTPEQRADELTREIFGPLLLVFPHIAPPIKPTDETEPTP